MGWLYMKSLKGHSGPRQYLDAQFTHERPDLISKVLRSALVDMRVYYAAVEQVRVATGQREVWAAICLVRYNPRDPEGYIFGYKDMEESMGPCESNCPAPILDLLTPTDREYAVQWRARCRENTVARRTRASKREPARWPGDRLRRAALVRRWPKLPAVGSHRQPAQPSHRALSCVRLRQHLSDSQHQEAVLPARRSPGVSRRLLLRDIKGSGAQRRTLFFLGIPRGKGLPRRV